MATLIDRLKISIKRLESEIKAGKDTVGTHRLLKDLKSQLNSAEAYKGQSARQVFFSGRPSK